MTDTKHNTDAFQQSRRDRERDEHRKAIMQAAERVFARKGMSSTTIEEIASEAQYSVGSIYNFFKGKEDLFKQVLLYISQLRLESVEELPPEIFSHIDVGLKLLIHTWLMHHVEHGNFLHIAMAQCAPGMASILPADDPVERKIMENCEKYQATMISFFKLMQKNGDIRPLAPNVMFIAFEGYVRTSLFRFYKFGVMTLPELESSLFNELISLLSK